MNLEEIYDDIGEPKLNYWKPKPNPVQVAPPSWCEQVFSSQFHSLDQNNTGPLQQSLYSTHSQMPGLYYPVTDINSYVPNQQPSFSGYEQERRRMPQTTQVSAESIMSALSTSSYQNGQIMSDSVIHEEVTRAAKTLFSKRNRTLLHWLNPGVSKSQLKIDVNAAWDSLPEAEKVFYISQVLGRFAPHTTSLMVNPQLESSKQESVLVTINTESNNVDDHANTSNDSGCASGIVQFKPKVSELRAKKPQTRRKQKKRSAEYKSDEEASCDSGLVMDIDIPPKPREGSNTGEPKVKRKYTKRKPKVAVEPEDSEGHINSNYGSLPVQISDIKVEPNSEPVTPDVPRVKRKYVKRKLVRKKYTRREPKNTELSEMSSETNSMVQDLQSTEDPCEEMDIWVDLENDADFSKKIEEFELLTEDVEIFWNSIGDPSNLFLELDFE